MNILGIETSCDETAAAILERDPSTPFGRSGRIHVLSNVIASSASLQAKFGGIIPEQAAREQLSSIIPVIDTAISKSKCQISNIDSIAVTYGPGLIGSLLVGVETAKTLSIIWNKPLIPVNHLIGHFYANWIEVESRVKSQESSEKKSRLSTLATSHSPKFPCIGLLVSGGHTDLVLFESHGRYKYLGGTRDDAAGECFDKCARLLGLPYPGGPAIAQSAMKFRMFRKTKLPLAEQNSEFRINRGTISFQEIKLPRPLINEETFDFSFSGLKTAFFREVEQLKKIKQFNNVTIQQLAFEVQQAIIDVLIDKTLKAARKYNIDQIMLAGGVAANEKLKQSLESRVKSLEIKLYIPPPYLCTDNAAMIAAAGFFTDKKIDPLTLQADPNLALSY